MIPTVLVLGLLLGRWWWSVPLLAAAWGAVILVINSTLDPGMFFGAAAFGAANAAVGFLVHQVVRLLIVAHIKNAQTAVRR